MKIPKNQIKGVKPVNTKEEKPKEEKASEEKPETESKDPELSEDVDTSVFDKVEGIGPETTEDDADDPGDDAEGDDPGGLPDDEPDDFEIPAKMKKIGKEDGQKPAESKPTETAKEPETSENKEENPVKPVDNPTVNPGPVMTMPTQIEVARQFKKDGTWVEGKGDSETIKVKAFPLTGVALVGYKNGYTASMKELGRDFEFARVDVSIQVPCFFEEIEGAYQFASKFCEDKLASELTRIYEGDETPAEDAKTETPATAEAKAEEKAEEKKAVKPLKLPTVT